MKPRRESLQIVWGVRASRAWATARCAECDRKAEVSLSFAAIPGFRGEIDNSAQARATLSRALVLALREKECAHALHDPVVIADCALRPDSPSLAAALAALFEAEETEINGILQVQSLSTKWAQRSLTLMWDSEALPKLDARPWVEKGERTRSATVTIDPLEAWELLAARGLVPVSWLEDSERRFYLLSEESPAKRRKKATDHHTPSPATLRACVSLASNGAGAVGCETLAREAFARMRPWGAFELQRISWRTVDASSWSIERLSGWSKLLRTTLSLAASRKSIALPIGYESGTRSTAHAWWTVAAEEGSLALAWERLREEKTVITDASKQAIQRDFTKLANPYEPLLAIWSTGFALESFDKGEAILVAPEW